MLHSTDLWGPLMTWLHEIVEKSASGFSYLSTVDMCVLHYWQIRYCVLDYYSVGYMLLVLILIFH